MQRTDRTIRFRGHIPYVGCASCGVPLVFNHIEIYGRGGNGLVLPDGCPECGGIYYNIANVRTLEWTNSFSEN